MPDMLVIIPSRNRPKSVAEITKDLLEQSIDIDICFGLDDDDISEYTYVPGVIYERNPRVLMNGTNNIIATKYADNYKFICFLGDDVRPRTFGWDKILSEPLMNKPGISYANDLIQKEFLPTHVVMSSEIIKALGFMAPPVLKHLYLDNFWLDLGNATNSIHYFENVILEHMHPLLEKASVDKVYLDSWGLVDDDKAAYENYKNVEFSKDVEKVMKIYKDPGNLCLEKIYVSIASYRDKELIDTVYSILRKAKNPERVFLSIFSQDELHPKLENIFNLFGVKDFSYEKVHFSEAKGVGYARSKTQEKLSLDFKYYMQIDSHTRFIQDWDELLISEYKESQSFWKTPIIFSSYPMPYTYNKNGNEVISSIEGANITTIKKVKSFEMYKPDYHEKKIANSGELHAHFCAGFVFGLSEYILKVPYDKNIYFIGEEHTMSIRFFCQGISIIAPRRSYAYHHYYGEKTRDKHWEIDPGWGEYERATVERVKKFFLFEELEGYGIVDKDRYLLWENTFFS
jgi:hypothetical protein